MNVRSVVLSIVSREDPFDQQLVEICVAQGYHVGILGAILVLVLFIQSVFIWFGRSSIPPWSKSSKRGSVLWEVLKTAIILTSNLASIASGIWLLVTFCTVPDSFLFGNPRIGVDDVGVTFVLGTTTIMRVLLGGIGGMSSMLIGFRRVLAIRTGKEEVPPCRKTIMASNLLMGLTGWCYLVPLAMTLLEFDPITFQISQSVLKIFSIAYWAFVVFVTLVLLFGGIITKMTQVKPIGWNLLIAFIFIGGFACAIYTEIFWGLALRTILLLPKEDRAALAWVHVGGAMVAHWLMGG